MVWPVRGAATAASRAPAPQQGCEAGRVWDDQRKERGDDGYGDGVEGELRWRVEGGELPVAGGAGHPGEHQRPEEPADETCEQTSGPAEDPGQQEQTH